MKSRDFYTQEMVSAIVKKYDSVLLINNIPFMIKRITIGTKYCSIIIKVIEPNKIHYDKQGELYINLKNLNHVYYLSALSKHLRKIKKNCIYEIDMWNIISLVKEKEEEEQQI